MPFPDPSAHPQQAVSEPAEPWSDTDSTKEQNDFFEDVHFLGDAAGKIVIRSPPVFKTAASSRLYHKQHLAAAFRVFAKQGFDEGVAGHISLRDPQNPHHFWINPLSKHFSQIRVSDLVLVDEDGAVLPGGAQLPINGPAFAIHSEIHKARPGVNAACHAHSVYGKAFSTFGRVIEPLYQDAIRFYNDLSGELLDPIPPSGAEARGLRTCPETRLMSSSPQYTTRTAGRSCRPRRAPASPRRWAPGTAA